MNIAEAAEELGLELRSLFPRVVGVSLRRSDAVHGKLELCVDLNKDIEGIPKEVPKEYYGHRVHIRYVGIPWLAAVGSR